MTYARRQCTAHLYVVLVYARVRWTMIIPIQLQTLRSKGLESPFKPRSFSLHSCERTPRHQGGETRHMSSTVLNCRVNQPCIQSLYGDLHIAARFCEIDYRFSVRRNRGAQTETSRAEDLCHWRPNSGGVLVKRLITTVTTGPHELSANRCEFRMRLDVSEMRKSWLGRRSYCEVRISLPSCAFW